MGLSMFVDGYSGGGAEGSKEVYNAIEGAKAALKDIETYISQELYGEWPTPARPPIKTHMPILPQSADFFPPSPHVVDFQPVPVLSQGGAEHALSSPSEAPPPAPKAPKQIPKLQLLSLNARAAPPFVVSPKAIAGSGASLISIICGEADAALRTSDSLIRTPSFGALDGSGSAFQRKSGSEQAGAASMSSLAEAVGRSIALSNSYLAEVEMGVLEMKEMARQSTASGNDAQADALNMKQMRGGRAAIESCGGPEKGEVVGSRGSSGRGAGGGGEEGEALRSRGSSEEGSARGGHGAEGAAAERQSPSR